MPSKNPAAQLLKADRRKQWKALKSKHRQALTAAKLDFDLKLGPALDKYQTQVDKLTKLAAKGELTSLQIQPVMDSVPQLDKIITSYHDKLKILSDPAKKELTALLTAIDTDCHSWTDLALTLQSRLPSGPTDAQKAAAHAVGVYLDDVSAIAEAIVARGLRAKIAYETDPPKPRPVAAALVSHMVEAARLAGPAAREAAAAATAVAKGSNYELFKTRAKAAAGLITRLRDASQAFEDLWDISLDVGTLSANFDAQALHGKHNQLVAYCDAALNDIHKLP